MNRFFLSWDKPACRAVAERLLPSGGLLLMEHGAGQGEAARELCGAAWDLVLTGKDYAGLDRYLLAIRR